MSVARLGAVPAGRAITCFVLIAFVSACAAQPDPVNPTGLPQKPSASIVPTPPPSSTLVASPSAPPSADVEPSGSSVPDRPTPPPDIPAQADPFAQLERDGIRLSLQLERNPIPSGQETWARTILTNESNRVLHWGTDGCGVAVWIRGSMPDSVWRGGQRPASDQLDTFKRMALDGMSPGQSELMAFRPDAVRQDGFDVEEFGCGDVFVGHDLGPGASIVERHHWDGTVFFGHSPMSAGPLDVVATFATWWRGADTPDHRGQPIELNLAAWVSGVAEPPRLDPAEAIDAALANPEWAAWIESRGDLRNAKRPFVRYDPDRHLWRVGLTSYNPTRTRVCNVDAETGEVVGITGPTE